jgi:8-oxo-dGTP diphosphatase
MADINKSALLILNDDATKFLVTRKSETTTLWLMPGGGIEPNETIEESVAREIREELGCETDMESFLFVGEYEALAAGYADKRVNIKLYSGKIIGDPVPSSEIVAIGWIGKEDRENQEVSEIIREHIIPDLVARGILR